MFDPFGDYETAGYLRNELALKDPGKIKEQEHLFFTANVRQAAAYLAERKDITYADFCAVHAILFSEFYPWAGRDRMTLGVARLIDKGEVQFEVGELAKAAVEHGLRMGSDRKKVAANPGEVMGMFAWGHPFLDGNGRTMVVVHAELMARTGLMIDWSASPKNDYLAALTAEIKNPPSRHLDAYLIPLVRALPKGTDRVAQVLDIVGLDGAADGLGSDETDGPNDPNARYAYEAFKRARQYSMPAE